MVNKRAKASIGFYHLDEGTWNGKREDLMRDVGILCDKVNQAAMKGDTATYEALLDEVASCVHPFAEFSSAAMQVVIEKNLAFHLNPLPSLAVERSTAPTAVATHATVPANDGGQS